MKILWLSLLYIFLVSNTFAGTPTEDEIVKVRDFVNQVFDIFENPDLEKFKEISVSTIYCTICGSFEETLKDGFMIETELFFKNHLNEIAKSDLWIRALKSNEIKYYKEPDHNNNISDITVFFTTWKRGESHPRHEGAQLGIAFKKIGNNYKFSGIETVP